MAKTMCKVSKELPDSFDKVIGLITNAEFVCKKCGRVANKEDRLCKSYKLG